MFQMTKKQEIIFKLVLMSPILVLVAIIVYNFSIILIDLGLYIIAICFIALIVIFALGGLAQIILDLDKK